MAKTVIEQVTDIIMPSSRNLEKRRISRKRNLDASIEAIVGIVVALAVALAVFNTSLAQVGADYSQRILIWVHSPGGALGIAHERPPKHLRSPPEHWVFVDLAGRFCDMGGAKRCPPDRLRTDRAALAVVLHDIREQKPRLVVLDVLTDRLSKPWPQDGSNAKVKPTTDPGEESLINELSRPGSPVLMAWYPTTLPTVGDPTILNANDHNLLLPLVASGEAPARYFPSLKVLTGPVARKLEPVFGVTFGPGTIRFPGLSYAAALVARAPRPDAPWELVDKFDQSLTANSCNLLRPASCRDYARTERVFSFPARRVGDEPVLTRAEGTPVFSRLDLAPGDRVKNLNDAIVVIGDSRQIAGDRTWSAIRDVSGAELILNDIRQYSEAPAAPMLSPLDKIVEEWPFFLGGLLGVFASRRLLNGHLFENGVAFRRGISRLTLALRQGLISAGELVLASIFCVILFGTLLLLREHHFGWPPDFVTPFVAVLLERAFDLTNRVIAFLHDVLHKLFGGEERHEVPEIRNRS
jgi:hypothetical protein